MNLKPDNKTHLIAKRDRTHKCRGERVESGGFCRKMRGDSINFIPKPAPTLDFLPPL
ncbi:MAG: hypothetical protein RID53_06010 [Coleofasciculus sp. B1-GNL1-01]|uniref:hypothetical protein n=1 Tax=Coleofasciculus sp. B1-GNL1-01 TaxID=3068484 RepID=UPI0032FBCFF5